MCTSKHWATENWPFFSGVGFVCLAYQSCENNRVCIASSLFQVVHHIWVLRPDGTQPCVLITMASGYGEHPWLAPQVGSFQYKWWQPWQSKHDLYWASFFYTHTRENGDRRIPSGTVLSKDVLVLHSFRKIHGYFWKLWSHVSDCLYNPTLKEFKYYFNKGFKEL